MSGPLERWSSIAGVPLSQDADGPIVLPLDNAQIRFVEATDGRGDGLGGIDVVVADRARLLAAAESRGCRVSDTRVDVGGVRFTLIDA